ncbi:MAG TPA: ABC transporter ATP-binding protein [Ktedonobacteraceae bacterium]
MIEEQRDIALEVAGLTRIYGRLVAVDGVSFAMKRGEAFGFLGPNGAGKSTVVKMLTGLVTPTSGSIRVLGQPVGNLETRRRVGYLPELPTFHRWLKAGEFLTFHGQLYGLRGQALRRRCLEALALVGLDGRERQRLGTFSKGMLQRIGLAQALINQPELLILDELVSGLDPVGVRDMRELLRQLKTQGISIFLNSHQLADVEALCDRIAIINHGQILKIGTPASLFAGPITLEVRVSQASPDLLRLLRALAPRVELAAPDPASSQTCPQTLFVEVENEARAADIASAIHNSGARLYALAPRRNSLEQLFFQTIDAAHTAQAELHEQTNATVQSAGEVQPLQTNNTSQSTPEKNHLHISQAALGSREEN